jgi:hypothetical protein
MKFNEDARVKIPSILHLMQLGYTYLSLKDTYWIQVQISLLETVKFYQQILVSSLIGKNDMQLKKITVIAKDTKNDAL